MDQFLEEAEEFISQVQTGAFDRKIAKIVANSETKLLDRFISVGRNALSVLTRVRRLNPAGRAARELGEAGTRGEPGHLGGDGGEVVRGESQLASRLAEWLDLKEHARAIEPLHLRDLIADERRVERLQIEDDGILLDFSRQRLTTKTVQLLLALAQATGLRRKIRAMAAGEEINYTEGRPVLHMALRAPRGDKLEVGGVDVVAQVHEVRDAVDAFAERVRSGEHRGATGKVLKNVVVVGIGGSSLGPAFLYEALKATPLYSRLGGREVRFLANIDEVDTARAIAQLDAAETLVVVTSKSFGTRETLINACTLRQWLIEELGSGEAASRRRRSRPSTSPRARACPRPRAVGASLPSSPSPFGTGWAAATRSPPASATCRSRSPSVAESSMSSSKAATRWTRTSPARRPSATCP